MKRRLEVLGVALVCSWVASCGGALERGGDSGTPIDAGGVDSGTPIAFVPSTVSATRYPAACGANPPFTNGDLFFLDIVGATTTGSPYNGLSVTFNSPAPPVGTPVSLSPGPFLPQGTGVGSGTGTPTYYPAQQALGIDSLNFQYDQGANPSEIDTGAFDAVTFTLVQLPAKDGDPFAVRLEIHFVDGKELDHPYSSPLTTIPTGCPTAIAGESGPKG